MKRGVEDRDVKRIGKGRASGIQRTQRGAHVREIEREQRLEFAAHVIVDHDGVLELRAAVNDAMTDGAARRQRVQLRFDLRATASAHRQPSTPPSRRR